MTTGPSSYKSIYLLFFTVILIWGVNWPIMKLGLIYTSPLWFCSIRILSGAICLFLILIMKNRLRVPTIGDFPIIFTVGALQIGCSLALIHTALTQVSAGQSAIIAYTTPVWTAPLAVMLLGERLNVKTILGLLSGIGGIIVLLMPMSKNLDWKHDLTSNIYLIIAAVLWAITIIHVRKHKWTGKPIELMPFMMLTGAFLIVPCALFLEGTPEIQWGPQLIAVLFYNGPIASAFCFCAYITVAKFLPSTTTATCTLGVPVVGVLSSALLLNETIDLNKIISLALICLGIIFASTDNKTKQPLSIRHEATNILKRDTK